jgi:opacity protein-like surface antigen
MSPSNLRALVIAAAATCLSAFAAHGIAADGPADVTAAAAQHGAGSSDPGHAGIWKAVSPPGGMRGEFDNNDPIGLAAGKKIEADCSLNWVDPDFGKRYCFSSATSLVYFLNAPRSYLARARKNWTGLSSVPP